MHLLRRHRDPKPPARRSAVSVAADWLAWPTLASRGGQIKTAGVFYHQDALRRVVARYGTLVMAELRIESVGEYAGAVRVFVGGELLGSIPQSQAEVFRAVVQQLHEAGQPATCRADLDLGYETFDVWLVARPESRPADSPFLPPSASCRVVLDPGQAERLDEALHSKAKRKRVVKLATLSKTSDSWEVALDEHRVGVLDGQSHPALSAVVASGFPLTCWVRIRREPDRPLRVEADIPTSRG